MDRHKEPGFIDVTSLSQRALADAMPVLVMVTDADGVVTYFNRRWYEFTGQQPFHRDVHEDWRRYMHPDDVEAVTESWNDAVRLGRDLVEMEYRVRHAATEEYRWFAARAVAMRGPGGKILQWIGTATDVDDERKAKSNLARLYEHERTVAAAFQHASLPPQLPVALGVRFDAFYQPSSHDMAIGGDWYDAFILPDGSVAVSVGDVVGHGLEATIIMGKIRYSLRTLITRAYWDGSINLASALRSVEDVLNVEHPGSAATAFLGIISADRNTFRFVSAGHPPPLLVGSAGTAWLETFGSPLGWRFGQHRLERSADLSGVFHLVLYTDGLVESGRDINEGMNHLRRAVETAEPFESTSPAQLIASEALLEPPHDDVAVLTASFTSQ